MRRRVVVAQHTVAADRQHFAITHHHCAERTAGLVDNASLPHGLDRLRHMLTILLSDGLLCSRSSFGQHLVASE